MPRVLAHDYGRTSEYTEGQVKTALKKLGYSEEYEDITISIYCNNEVAIAFGIDEAHKGYPQQHRVNLDAATGAGGYAGGGTD